ncbi:MAG: hypothetical protein ACI9CA_000224, partial [Natronomonas sp.]
HPTPKLKVGLTMSVLDTPLRRPDTTPNGDRWRVWFNPAAGDGLVCRFTG